jgi:hypothetical protein
MIRRDAEAVSHETPYKRIEIGSSTEVDRRHDIVEALSGVGPTERDRIWRMIEQAVVGAGVSTAPPQSDDETPAAVVEEHLPATGGFVDEPTFLRDRSGA